MVDYLMFWRSTPHGIVLLILYIDDMVITESDHVAIVSLKRHLQSEFEMKDLGFLRYFFGIKVAYFRGYLLSQQKYIVDLLDRATLSDPATSTFFSVFTLMELHLKLKRDDGTPLPQHTWYQELVRSIIYLSATRSDISQVVHVLSQFVSAPTSVDYVALFCVLRYLQSTISRSLLYSYIHLFLYELILTSDGPMVRTQRSTTGFCNFFFYFLSHFLV